MPQGLLKDATHGHQPDLENDPVEREENYEKDFMKIGRDFVHRDDFVAVLQQVLDIISLAVPQLRAILAAKQIDFKQLTGAMAKAQLYHKAIEGEPGTEVGRFIEEDLIKSKELGNKVD